jgi:hypothetical protein
MASPMRLNSDLIDAAKKEGLLQKRSIPRQIEYWAELGRVVEGVIDLKEVFAVRQGVKTIKLESLSSAPVDPDDVFNDLERSSKRKGVSSKLTSAPFYYEASRSQPGLLDRVNVRTGERQTGHFRNGEFKTSE